MKQPVIFYFITLMMLLASCQRPAGNQTEDDATGTLFIIGGGSRPAGMVERMIEESGIRDTGYVAILPMSSSLPDSAIIWSGEQFYEQGMDRVAGFNFQHDQTPKEEWLDSLRKAPLIYISGGNQNRFMNIVMDSPIMDAIHTAYANGAVIAGTSAGAAVMCEMMITGDELRYEEYRSTFPVIEWDNIELAPGLGLLETAIVDQHFVWRSRHNRLITAVLEYPALPGIGIDESTAIIVNGNQAEVVGEAQVLVYTNPEGTQTRYREKMGGENLRLDIYLPGDIFAIQE